MPTELLGIYFYNSLTAGFIAFVFFLFLGQKDVNISSRARKRIWILLGILMLLPIKIVIPAGSTIFLNSPFQRLYLGLTNKVPANQMIQSAFTFMKNNYLLGLTILELLTLIWMVGAVLFFISYALNYIIFLFRVLPFCRKIKRQIHKDICLVIKYELGLEELINVYYCPLIKQPVVIGFIRKKILIPYRKYSTEAFYFMVKRQMIHCECNHLRYLFLLRFANAIHWFNPFSYKILEQYRHDIESLCQTVITVPLSKHGTKLYYDIHYKELGNFEDSFKFNNIF